MDYAVLRLAQTPGMTRRWADLDARAVVPKADTHIVLLQHPGGYDLKWDQNDIVAPEVAWCQVIPRLRFLHRANAVGGSSGGPCFDRTFMLFGLHQGEWTRGKTGLRINRGVPIV